MKKYKFLKEVEIRPFSHKDSNDILNLITDEYRLNYPEKEFYEQNVINKYIEASHNTEKVRWKGAFHKGKLIGQMMGITIHGSSFLKLAMVRREYRRMDVMKLLASNMENLINTFNKSEFGCIYAFVEKNSMSMQNFISNFQFIKLGTTPTWKIDNYFFIFGRIAFDFKWKLIRPNLRLSVPIYKNIVSSGLKRIISTGVSIPSKSLEKELDEIYLIRKEDGIPTKIIISSKKKAIQAEIYAEMYENIYQKSWYDFRFVKNISMRMKEKIINRILKEFQGTDHINSLSIAIDANDMWGQDLMLKYKMEYFAFLPSYLEGKDALLLGKSKIKN